MERKILLQIAREEEERLSFTTNELTHLEMRALVCHMENLLDYFRRELTIDNDEDVSITKKGGAK